MAPKAKKDDQGALVAVVPPTKLPDKFPDPINPDGVRSVYANNAEVSMSVFDVRFTFNEIIIDHAGAVTVERRANVVMSIPHMHALMLAMQQQIRQLEERVKEAAAPAKTAQKQ